ncbi:hypothetical protein [Tissierella praeacuta]|uniref:hypothetical protein n=1 Tax=Tissierella praeacuta TaxID=43131 RepID=UPI0028A8D786|nr:hypothetical protein [Tissierella praeacuta]
MKMKEYIVYRCKICGKSFILLSEEVKFNEKQGNYISCPFKGHKNIVVTGAYDSIKECMQERSYRRDRGKMKQFK